MSSSVFVNLFSIQKNVVRSTVSMSRLVRSKLPMSRLSCVQSSPCPVYRAFIRVSRPCNFELTTPPPPFVRLFRSAHINFRSGTSAWGRKEVQTPVWKCPFYENTENSMKKYISSRSPQKDVRNTRSNFFSPHFTAFPTKVHC